MINSEEVKTRLFTVLSGFSVTVVFAAEPYNTAATSAWVEADVVTYLEQPHRRSQASGEGEMQLKVFVREGNSNAYRAEEVVDSLRGLFNQRDFITATNKYSIRCSECTVVELGEEDGVIGKVVRCPFTVSV